MQPGATGGTGAVPSEFLHQGPALCCCDWWMGFSIHLSPVTIHAFKERETRTTRRSSLQCEPSTNNAMNLFHPDDFTGALPAVRSAERAAQRPDLLPGGFDEQP